MSERRGSDNDDRPSLTYRDAGVDIDAQDEALRRIKDFVRGTRTPGVLSELGSFGGLFAPDWKRYRDPVLPCGARVLVSSRFRSRPPSCRRGKPRRPAP